MTVTAFRVQNFMGFEDSGWIELRPITLLFGRNSSGKSALVRALLLLRQSLESEPGGSVLRFARDDAFDLGDYQEIVRDHQTSRDMSFSFKVQFRGDLEYESDHDQRRALDAINDLTVPAYIPIKERPVTQSLTIRLIYGQSVGGSTKLGGIDLYTSNGDLILRADKLLGDLSNENGRGSWTVATEFFDPGADEPDSTLPDVWQHVEFFNQAGFLPGIRLDQNIFGEMGENISPEDAAKGFGDNFSNVWLILKGIRRAISLFLEQLDYLGPLRSAPQRFYYVAGQGAGSPERGKNFVRNLTKADLPSIENINHWLKVAGTPYRLQLQSLDERKRLYELRLLEQAENKPGELSVNIREVGFGITQMLPIVAQAVLSKPGDTLIIEQPELHLHPRAQADLTDLFIALTQQGTSFLIETHSEHLLLRLRRRIAETAAGQIRADSPARLTSEDLRCYFVERVDGVSVVETIEIDELGKMSSPSGFRGFFADDLQELALLNQAILSMQRD